MPRAAIECRAPGREHLPLSPVDSSRRAFLRGSLLTTSGRAREARRRQPLGPPPPWHAGLPLASHCPSCPHPCVAACETNIIRLYPPEHPLAGIPYLDFSRAGCTFCRACVDACPVGEVALEQAGPAPRIGEAQLEIGKCLAWNGVICQSCVEHCSAGALGLDRLRQVHVDPDRCTGCGMCIPACPEGALHLARSASD